MEIYYIEIEKYDGFSESLLLSNNFYKETHCVNSKTYSCYVKILDNGYIAFIRKNILVILPDAYYLKLYEDNYCNDSNYCGIINIPMLDIHYIYDIFKENIEVSKITLKIKDEIAINNIYKYWRKITGNTKEYANKNDDLFYIQYKSWFVDYQPGYIKGYYGRLNFYTQCLDYQLEEED